MGAPIGKVIRSRWILGQVTSPPDTSDAVNHTRAFQFPWQVRGTRTAVHEAATSSRDRRIFLPNGCTRQRQHPPHRD